MAAAKLAVAALCLVPAALLIWRGATGRLTANPIEFITLETGFWALTLLMVTLAITPARRITGWNRIIAFRRTIGLFAFFYATLHFLTYVTLDRFFDFREVGADIVKRPYITVGFTAFVLLVPLAVTSTRGWVRRLGSRWQKLHRLVYAAAALGVLHFYWKKASKADVSEPLLFAGILGALLLFRIGYFLLRRRTPRRHRTRTELAGRR
jgi:methionine sulfoxide reductase heme-binding subunit